MFLAINEIRHSKLRYALVTGVMFLIAYLVFFLTGLAYGLAQDNRMAVDKWEADQILLTEEANDNLNMSMLPRSLYDEVDAPEKAVLAQTAGVVTKEDNGEKVDVTFFGIDPDQFLAPNITDGEMFASDDEAVADSSIEEEYGISIGDTIKLAGSDKKLKIVGFTDNARFSVAPVLYTSIGAYQEIRFEKEDDSENARINAIVTRGKIKEVPDDLVATDISKFINELPGYNAQVLTFGFMIGFLIVIAAIVIGIFIYVLTISPFSTCSETSLTAWTAVCFLPNDFFTCDNSINAMLFPSFLFGWLNTKKAFILCTLYCYKGRKHNFRVTTLIYCRFTSTASLST